MISRLNRDNRSVLVQVYFGTQHAKMYLSADLLGINCVTGMSCLFRKDVVEEAGGFAYLGKFLAEDFYLGRLFMERSVTSSHYSLSVVSYQCSLNISTGTIF